MDLRFVSVPEFGAPHAITTRAGGVSQGPFASLNLGLSSGDDATRVEANRRRALQAFGVPRTAVTAFHQVHGDRVLEAEPSWFAEEADAATSTTPGLALVVSVADCFPLLFFDPVRGAVGIAHCGWRGTPKGLAGSVVTALAQRHGCDPADVRVLIGPGIRGPCYQVGPEVAAAFAESGFPEAVAWPDDEGRFRLDLVAANRFALQAAGVQAALVHDTELCTHCHPSRFFSYRRDLGRTGRHWAMVRTP